jgi:uncharacterized protein (DUF934 family)
MSILVTDRGFGPDDWSGAFLPLDALDEAADPASVGVDLAPADDPLRLVPWLGRIGMVRVRFPHFADGRGFTIGARLRRLGYAGRLRAQGHVLADQYRHARRAGFDEVEISAELALRQPEEHWRIRLEGLLDTYQTRLRGPSGAFHGRV